MTTTARSAHADATRDMDTETSNRRVPARLVKQLVKHYGTIGEARSAYRKARLQLDWFLSLWVCVNGAIIVRPTAGISRAEACNTLPE